MIERHKITSREQWLALRKADVTASTVAALFGAHPYTSPMALFAEKTGLELPQPDNAVLRRGRLLEGAVAEAVREERPGWEILKATEYLRDPELRLGATPDFYVIDEAGRLGVLQTKTTAPGAFKKHWADGPPFWVALQNATELMLDREAEFGVVATLVVDPFKLDVHLYDVPRHVGVETRIRDAVAKFWEDVAAGREPSPDYAKDAALIAAMYPEAKPLKTVDLSGNNMLPVILAERARLKDEAAKLEARIKEIETEVKFAIEDAEVATLPGWAITFKEQTRKAYSVTTTTFRALRITDNRQGTDQDGPF